MFKVKIFGAGSIGNHLGNAARTLGWAVDICDIDPQALERTRCDIYPVRYGKWDETIRLLESDKAPRGGYDLICVGTPPDSHMKLALAAVDEKPRAVLVEKPACTPDLVHAQELADRAGKNGVAVFVGYDHVVGEAAESVGKLLAQKSAGALETLDVEFREHWGGIFAAHPWLDGPADSYLGYWQRGGGACGEHSHAANLWQYFSHQAGAGRIVEVGAALDYVKQGKMDYDRLCLLNVRTEGGLTGRVVQDVVTRPTRKWGRAQGSAGAIEWICAAEPGKDVVVNAPVSGTADRTEVRKTRPDDFIRELRHIDAALAGGAPEKSPISLERGLETMLVIAAAHRSAQTGRVVRIDHSKGFVPEALS
jgi:predicted dehydrogenase